MKKVLSAILATVLVLLLVGCGDQTDTENDYDATENDIESTAEVVTEPISEVVNNDDYQEGSLSGSQQEWDDITVFVPDRMEVKMNSDDHILTLKEKNKEDHYIMIMTWLTELGAKNNVEVETATNMDKHPENISFVAGAEWTGVTYSDEGVIRNYVYAAVGDQTYYVRAAGYSYDSFILTAVLESLH